MSSPDSVTAPSEKAKVARDVDNHPLWGSWGNLVGIQTLNAFNDNVGKLILIGVAASTIGEQVYKNLAFALTSVAFILFGPIAGWCSDRFSKRGVLIACLWAQLGCLGLIAFGPWLGAQYGFDPASYRDADQHWLHPLLSREMLPIWVATLGLFLISVQSAFFSPAKLGIVVELVGRKRLGFTNSWMQMATMIAIILGTFLGGSAYPWVQSHYGASPWMAGVLPLLPLIGVSVFALWSGYAMKPVPAINPSMRFHWTEACSHFREMSLLFGHRAIRRTSLAKGWTWFVAVFVNLAMIQVARDSGVVDAQISAVSGRFIGLMGIGIVVGAGIAAAINAKRNELGLIPMGAFLLGIMLIVLGVQNPVGGWDPVYLTTLASVGIGAAFLLIPLGAHLQDIAPPERRGSVLAGSSVLDSIFQVSAAAAQLVLGEVFNWSTTWQLCSVGIATLIVGVTAFRILPRETIIGNTRPLFNAIWRIKVFGAERVPRKGGVLLCLNHVSYLDAFIYTAACPRPIRFVVEEKFYQMWWAHWFLKYMGCIPITQRKARGTIKTVVEALKQGDVVAIFPEGELTRDGKLRQLRRGFETIARVADVAVIPVSMNGMFRSLLGRSTGVMLCKKPSLIRATISFGHPLSADQMDLESLEAELLHLRELNYRMRPETTPDSHPNPDKVREGKPDLELELPPSVRDRKRPDEKDSSEN